MRAADLREFRQAMVDLACGGEGLNARNRLVVVPTRAAAAHMLRTIEDQLGVDEAFVLPDFVTRDELTLRLADRLGARPRILTESEREVFAGVACRMAIADGIEPPFRLRPGLIAEIVRFYDSLRRNLKTVESFERLALGALEPGAAVDRGAERLVRQTRFLVKVFRHFERLVATAGCVDEHLLRERLISEPAAHPWRHVVLGVADYASDRCGLLPADWDLLARIPGLECIDVVATDGSIAGAFHERIHHLLPGIEEVRVVPSQPISPPPTLIVAADGTLAHTARDREEEVAGFARWVRGETRNPGVEGPTVLGRVALIVRRPLPYVYLTREVLRSAGIPVQMFDALPLASEPFAAALDLIVAFVTGNFARGPSIALLRSPHFRFDTHGDRLTPADMSGLDRALSDAGYLGDLETLERLVASWREAGRRPAVLRAADTLLNLARRLAPLRSPASPGDHLAALDAFLIEFEAVHPQQQDSIGARHQRGRAAVFTVLRSLRDAYARYDSHAVEFEQTTAVLRRWIDAHTFAPRTGDAGVHLVDADSARFGSFDVVQLAGLVDGEWPDTPRRNIFYPPALLRELGWPSETERLDGIRSAFVDLLRLPSRLLTVSSFSLEDDAVVAPSTLIDVLPVAGLQMRETAPTGSRIFEHEALGLDPVETSCLGPAARTSAARRLAAVRERRPGETAGHTMAAYSLSALERYQDCPFKFFATDVLKLDEPLEDEPMLSPRERGRFVHEVFQRFFEAWDARGHGTITSDRVDEARELFRHVAEPLLARFSEAEALLERARLFGSAASIGIVDVVLGLEASREVPIRDRWLEHRFEGTFSLGVPGGPSIPIKGVADRIDLLEGNRLRVIDYKSGYAPHPKRALQAPIYALCAQERLSDRDHLPWQIDEASYVAFGGKRPLVPVVKGGTGEAAQVLNAARTRALDIVDAIGRGDFPPRPYELRICSYCAYPSVCRKDYVGDE